MIPGARWTDEDARTAGKRVPEPHERAKLVADAHNFGHFGRDATFNRLAHSDNVWWKGMREACQEHIVKCVECLRFNIAAAGYHPMRSSAHKASEPFDHDFVPQQKGKDTSLVLVRASLVLTIYFGSLFEVKTPNCLWRSNAY